MILISIFICSYDPLGAGRLRPCQKTARNVYREHWASWFAPFGKCFTLWNPLLKLVALDIFLCFSNVISFLRFMRYLTTQLMRLKLVLPQRLMSSCTQMAQSVLWTMGVGYVICPIFSLIMRFCASFGIPCFSFLTSTTNGEQTQMWTIIYSRWYINLSCRYPQICILLPKNLPWRLCLRYCYITLYFFTIVIWRFCSLFWSFMIILLFSCDLPAMLVISAGFTCRWQIWWHE